MKLKRSDNVCAGHVFPAASYRVADWEKLVLFLSRNRRDYRWPQPVQWLKDIRVKVSALLLISPSWSLEAAAAPSITSLIKMGYHQLDLSLLSREATAYFCLLRIVSQATPGGESGASFCRRVRQDRREMVGCLWD